MFFRFSQGRATGLVVDCGYDAVVVTPVFDGFVLKGGMQRQESLGGSQMTLRMEALLRDELNVTIRTSRQVLRKEKVELKQPAKAVLRDYPSECLSSYVDYTRKVCT